MAKLSKLPLAEARPLLERFGIRLLSIEPLEAGSVNSNFELRDEAQNRFFARIYEEQGRRGAEAELRLLGELSRAGVPTVVPLHSAEGVTFAELGDKVFAVFPWVEGAILCQRAVTPNACRCLGAALARLHQATSAVTPLGEGRFRVVDMLKRLDAVGSAESVELRRAADSMREKALRHSGRRLEGLPQGVVHGDLFRDNVLWRGDAIAALLDFESASFGPFVYDLAVTILAWCYGAAFEPELLTALLDGYQSERPLSDQELEAFDAEAALACVRFATTRITDFSLRAPPGQPPARDYRRFLHRLRAVEAGALRPFLCKS
jgi:homoserine kinase type II